MDGIRTRSSRSLIACGSSSSSRVRSPSTSEDRKSTRLNSSHVANSYAVFCLKKINIGAGLPAVALFLLFLWSVMEIFAGYAAFHDGLGWPWLGSGLIDCGILAVITIIIIFVA